MEKEQFDLEKKKIWQEAESAFKKLSKDFAFAKNTHSVGEVIRDHIGKGRITMVKYTYHGFDSSYYPECCYLCEELTAKGEPKKRPSQRTIYAKNLLTP